MTWARAHTAEIIGRRDDPMAEVIMPDAVDNHARGERMLGRQYPIRQSCPGSFSRVELRRILRHKDSQRPHADLTSFVAIVAPRQDMNGRSFFRVVCDA